MSDIKQRRIRMKIEVFTLSPDEKAYTRECEKEEILNVTLCMEDAGKLLQLLDVTMGMDSPVPVVRRP